jgi:hypothetical protein
MVGTWGLVFVVRPLRLVFRVGTWGCKICNSVVWISSSLWSGVLLSHLHVFCYLHIGREFQGHTIQQHQGILERLCRIFTISIDAS